MEGAPRVLHRLPDRCPWRQVADHRAPGRAERHAGPAALTVAGAGAGAGMTSSVEASIVVPCRNEARHIRSFLDSVLGQELAGTPIEVIVADGLSDDGTRDILAEVPAAGIRTSPPSTIRSGRSRARLNLGDPPAPAADIILRMDVHTRYASDYVVHCLQRVDGRGMPTTSAGRLAPRPPAFWPARSPRPTTLRTAAAARGSTTRASRATSTPCPTAAGASRRSSGFGLFDETFVRNQDDELNLRIVRAGGKIWQSPAIVVVVLAAIESVTSVRTVLPGTVSGRCESSRSTASRHQSVT